MFRLNEGSGLMKATMWAWVGVVLCGVVLCMESYAAGPAPTVHDLMKDVVAVQAQVIWDVGNQAMNDNGDPDPSKLKATDWAKLADAGAKVKKAAETLASTEHLMAAAPGKKIDGEGNPDAPTAASVQKALDKQPKVFAGFATALALSMDELLTATRKHDANKVNDVSGRLDQICEQCHVVFWYPDQKLPK